MMEQELAKASRLGISPCPHDLGRTVIYIAHDGAPPERGIITAVTHAGVFVRYGADSGSKLTPQHRLVWAA